MITILYFARFREKLGLTSEQLPLPEDSDFTVQNILDELAARGGPWQDIFGCEQGVLAAINQEMASRQSALYTGDELALFPPVTGG